MCTVTYIPYKEGFFITSNRDEKSIRQSAHAPAGYIHNGVTLVYPKDPDAGGTWIAIAENGNAAVLLNGAFVKHTAQPPYRKSRGNIFIELIAACNPVTKFQSTDLSNIEPFTVILFDNNELFECRWDGKKKYDRYLDKQQPAIWSSATLYEDEVMETRRRWFSAWLLENPSPSQENILRFHQFAGHDDNHNGLLMNRNNNMLTVSITGIQWQPDKARIRYLDIKDNTQSEHLIQFYVISETE
jgi:hypothetical protein